MKTILMSTKVMSTRCLSTSRRLALAFSLIAGLAGLAHAESFSVRVPFNFRVADKNLPAGNYTVESLAAGFMTIHGATSANTATVSVLPVDYGGAEVNPSLSFEGSPAAPMLAGIRMDSGATFSIVQPKRLAAASTIPAKGTVVLSRP